MATVETISAPKLGFLGSPVAFVEAAFARYTRYRLYRQTINELSALTSRELADLGLHRSMLKRVAYQAAYENN